MTQIFEKKKYSNFMKIHLVWAELFHVDGQWDITKLIVAFRNFVNASKSGKKTTTNWGPDMLWPNLCAVFATLTKCRREQGSDEATVDHGLQGNSVAC